MYPLLIASALSLSILLSLLLIPEHPHTFLGPFLALVAFIPTVTLLWRRTSNQVRPFFETAQRQAQSGNVAQAIESLEKALAYKNWQLFLEQQVNTEIGVFYWAQGKEKEAIERLRQGYPKVSLGHLVLGAALYRGGQLDEALKALELGIRYNKTSPVLYNVLAWILAKENRRDEAIEALTRGLKALKADEATSDNLERLRNDKRMNMKPFGDHWFMLRFETPKGMVAQAPARKGFRQPKKPTKREARQR